MPVTPTDLVQSHWMLREIHEQPETLAATFNRYVDSDGFRTEQCGPVIEWLKRIETKIAFAASGSSRHAGLVGELVIKDLSGISASVEYASEYSYQSEEATDPAAVVVISQSGETADTLAALRKATAAGLETLAITNVAESTMSHEATVSFPTVAGRERAIPATKSFTAQLLNVYLLALMAAAVQETMDAAELDLRLAEIQALPAKIESQLPGWEEAMHQISDAYASATNFLFLGRGIHYPIASEGALKLKESAYLHAEGYPSGELKHGPNALVAEGTPLVMIATVDRSSSDSLQRYEKVLQLMRDMRQQGADILAIANTGDRLVEELATHVVWIDETREMLMAICEVSPLQLFAYWVAVNHGIDVDNPRNLTKAVLAE
jgi:glucosamine--fructose-6-phosphate aminotransferase (isomerizing)